MKDFTAKSKKSKNGNWAFAKFFLTSFFDFRDLAVILTALTGDARTLE
jgi:hypothetical protein